MTGVTERLASRLGVRLLGEFRIDGAELEALRSRQARTLLKRLALERGATVSADGLVEAVWPSSGPPPGQHSPTATCTCS